VRGCDAAERDQLIGTLKQTLATQFKITHTTLQIESEAFEHDCHVC
jgi:hypothetical protein